MDSTYCYLLTAENHCDETIWGVHLLDLNKQGLCLDYTIADGGKGLRAGQQAAWGKNIPCHGSGGQVRPGIATWVSRIDSVMSSKE